MADEAKAPGYLRLSDRIALRPREAAAALGISERKLRELLPELPHVRRRGVLLFPVRALEAWVVAEAGPAPRLPHPAGEDEASRIAREELAKLGN